MWQSIIAYDVAHKIADLLNGALGYLIGKVNVQKEIIKNSILEISKFNNEDIASLYSVIDAFIAKCKIQSIL